MVGCAPPTLLGRGSRHCRGIIYTHLLIENWPVGSMSVIEILRQLTLSFQDVIRITDIARL
jgi:hypothetical protein